MNRNLCVRVKDRAGFDPALWKTVLHFSTLTIGLLLAFCCPTRIADGARDGFHLAFTTVLPSVFPFMVLSDLIVSAWDYQIVTPFRSLFSRLFGIPTEYVGAWLLGLFCGFPIGARSVCSIGNPETIDRKMRTNLAAYSTNPSPAFLIGAIGTLLSSAEAGYILFFAVLFSSGLTGCIIRKKPESTYPTACNRTTDFSLVSSVRNAALQSLAVCGFVVFFSTILSLIAVLPISACAQAGLACLLEIGTAAKVVSSLSLPLPLRMMMLGFSCGFSGVSVILQCFALPKSEQLDLRRFIFVKLLQGVLCAIFSFALSFLL